MSELGLLSVHINPWQAGVLPFHPFCPVPQAQFNSPKVIKKTGTTSNCLAYFTFTTELLLFGPDLAFRFHRYSQIILIAASMFVLREHLAVHSAGHTQWERFCSYVERSMVCHESKVNIELYRLIKQGLILCTNDTHIAATPSFFGAWTKSKEIFISRSLCSPWHCVFWVDITFTHLYFYRYRDYHDQIPLHTKGNS